ncbi:MAG: hypothetical protein E6I64_00390 [Chloroflexi bacterium]|nr:MAG: hypothetical protein E6I64_00390 [Chloroflexota bacterium]
MSWTRRTAPAELAAVALLASATAVAAIARRVGLPESVVLVLVGLAGAALFPAVRFAVTPALVLGVFVPGLVFAAAYAIDWSELRAVLGPVIGLAVPGVVASAAVVAAALSAVGLRFELAFVVGAITAATDPIAVVATMRRLSVPAGLRTLVESESLLNDGTGLVLFALAVRAITTGIGTVEGIALFLVTLVVSGVRHPRHGDLRHRARHADAPQPDVRARRRGRGSVGRHRVRPDQPRFAADRLRDRSGGARLGGGGDHRWNDRRDRRSGIHRLRPRAGHAAHVAHASAAKRLGPRRVLVRAPRRDRARRGPVTSSRFSAEGPPPGDQPRDRAPHARGAGRDRRLRRPARAATKRVSDLRYGLGRIR